MFARAFTGLSSRVALGLGIGASIGAAATIDTVVRSDSTRAQVEETLKVVKSIQADLGISDAAKPDAPKYSADDNYVKWQPEHTSLTRKYCTKGVYRKYYDVTTPQGFTFDQVIAPAIDLPMADGVHIGCVAGDAESYATFADFFDPLIEEYHTYPADRLHTTDLDYSKLRIPDFDPKYVLSTRIRAGRSVKGMPLPPAANRAARRETESLITTALGSLEGELSGKYYALLGMSKEDNDRLIDDHFLYENPDAWTIVSGFGRDWPDGRGIFHNDSKTFLVWINEEDHMRIISMEKGADVVRVFRRFADACNAVEASLKANGAGYAHTERLGYITTCPTNLGTGMRASVHASLPLLGKVPGFKDYAQSMGLQIRGRGGEKDMSYTGVFDVSNRFRLGYSEVQLVQMMLDGLEKLIQLEQKLERGETVTLK
eukprot:CAMPEP_0185570808 /NCGR_PEP_ID=MMETSP0434-20130131/2979_1 /TAXON_ID=626734 ORGANISM="Favella taraikaensis, Strain Fe Narragansett Bay" /NCGR_SAMPLE_ID=MMETSP0434 /ASSEMBLY_ACC=CAM_ASM_000379 /LENGTH=428 /DNA_ID=CAMNT_0028186013 /DNA_START=21 /DNA_END=1307 /DNA_ORIENTATION=-